ncbi:hypothetical protein GCM10009414_02540 [Tatumella terrea]|uniref:RcnB family protein n=1 Tax=Tatumella terrea TaxID=419007 RepID=UPI0031E26A7E
MRKPFVLASSVMLMTVSLLGVSQVNAEDAPVTPVTSAPAASPAPAEAPAASAPATAPSGTSKDPLDRDTVFGDFHHYAIGDVVPPLYRSATYNIAKWQLRKLPAPVAGSHWTYMGGDYILITDAEGKILRIISGDIIYR